MDGVTTAGTAFDEAVVFLSYFNDLQDPRQPGKVTYPLDEILLLCLLAVLAGAESFTEIALFGVKKLEFLRRFRPFKDGTPAHDHLGDILAVLDAEQFQRCFVGWVAALTGAPAGVVAIDGKTVRRSGHKRGGKAPIHRVSAFAARQRLVLGQVKVAEKSNEIVAIPKLLDMLAIEGAIVTIDAMGCQREIAQKILDRKADYVLALKGNQGSLREDVEVLVAEQKAKGFADTEISQDRTIDGDHDRIETGTTTVIHDVERLQERHDWPCAATGRSRRVCIGSWTWSSAMTSAASGPITPRPISPPLNTWPITCSERFPARTPCAAGARSQHGMTTFSRASSPRERFTRFPWTPPVPPQALSVHRGTPRWRVPPRH